MIAGLLSCLCLCVLSSFAPLPPPPTSTPPPSTNVLWQHRSSRAPGNLTSHHQQVRVTLHDNTRLLGILCPCIDCSKVILLMDISSNAGICKQSMSKQGMHTVFACGLAHGQKSNLVGGQSGKMPGTSKNISCQSSQILVLCTGLGGQRQSREA